MFRIDLFIMNNHRVSGINNKSRAQNGDTMLSARIHEYQKPLAIERIPKPTINHREQVLVRVEATGLCHSDLHLINGDWKKTIPLELPKVPGHEIAGSIEEIGESVPKNLFSRGNIVAVSGGWGCSICVHCKNGDEQLCNSARWPGITDNGGFSEYILVDSYRFLVRVNGKYGLKAEEIAPLTDAGLTPYRAIKKVRDMLGPGRSIAIFGIGGLGYYGVQYAKLLGQSAKVIALDRREEKLQLAENVGADYTINTSQYQQENLKKEALRITEDKGIDVVLDCAGAENTIYDSVRMLSKGGALVVVGLVGSRISVPLVPFVINEHSVYGSLWGNYGELCEVIELAEEGKIKHQIRTFALNRINEAASLLREGKIIGRAVITPN
jgi:alcohol dehydrogenase, propanol-preferring